MVGILFAMLCWALWHLAPHNILMLLAPAYSHFSGLKIAWLVQFFGILAGLAFFNGLHQIHRTRTGDNPQYRGPYDKKPARPSQLRRNK